MNGFGHLGKCNVGLGPFCMVNAIFVMSIYDLDHMGGCILNFRLMNIIV